MLNSIQINNKINRRNFSCKRIRNSWYVLNCRWKWKYWIPKDLCNWDNDLILREVGCSVVKSKLDRTEPDRTDGAEPVRLESFKSSVRFDFKSIDLRFGLTSSRQVDGKSMGPMGPITCYYFYVLFYL